MQIVMKGWDGCIYSDALDNVSTKVIQYIRINMNSRVLYMACPPAECNSLIIVIKYHQITLICRH